MFESQVCFKYFELGCKWIRILILKWYCFNQHFPQICFCFLNSESGVGKLLLIPKSVVCGEKMYLLKLLKCSLWRG